MENKVIKATADAFIPLFIEGLLKDFKVEDS